MSCTHTYITLFAQLYQAVIHACTSPRQQELVVLPIPWHRMMCPISHISQWIISFPSVKIYQRISETQHQAVSDILSAKRICVQHPIPPEQPQSSEVVPIQRQSSTFEFWNTTFTFILASFACSSVNINPRTQHTYRFICTTACSL